MMEGAPQPHDVVSYVFNGLFAVIILWMRYRAQGKAEEKTAEKQRTDLLNTAATEQYEQWKAIVGILKTERDEVVAKYIKKCEQLAEVQVELRQLQQGKK